MSDQPHETRARIDAIKDAFRGPLSPILAENAAMRAEIERLRLAIGAQCDHMDARAARFAGSALRQGIYNGDLVADELRALAKRYRGALAAQEDIEHVG